MLVKIGDGLFDPAEIVGVLPSESSVYRTTLLLRGDRRCTVRGGADEITEDLIAAGLFADPEGPALPELSPEERDELKHLGQLGFGWIARDGDGKLFAYRDFPQREGVYWCGSLAGSETLRLSCDYDFVKAEDANPWAIEDLL